MKTFHWFSGYQTNSKNKMSNKKAANHLKGSLYRLLRKVIGFVEPIVILGRCFQFHPRALRIDLERGFSSDVPS